MKNLHSIVNLSGDKVVWVVVVGVVVVVGTYDVVGTVVDEGGDGEGDIDADSECDGEGDIESDPDGDGEGDIDVDSEYCLLYTSDAADE